MTIRLATPQDAQAIRELQTTVWKSGYLDVEAATMQELSTGRRLESAEKVAELEERLSSPDIRAWVAEENNEVVGCCMVRRYPAKGKIRLLYVQPEFQHRGIGQQLIDQAFAWLDKDKPITLWIFEKNRRGISWYEQRGFRYNRPIEDRALKLPSGVELRKIEMIRVVRDKY